MSQTKSQTKIALIGGGEIFIRNRPLGQLQFGPENPGTISIDCTGQAWQLALDLASDGCMVEFISVAGNDFAGRAMKAQLMAAGVGVDHFNLIDGKDTAAKHEILNLLDQPEMEFQNDEVFAHMTTAMIDLVGASMEQSDCIVLETRFPEAVINHVVRSFSHKPILLCPISVWDAERAKGLLGEATGLLTGRRQAEVLSELSILSEEELQAAAAWFAGAGIKQLFMDLGFGGVYFKDQTGEGVQRPGPIRLATIVEGFANHQPAALTAAKSIENLGE
jgi:pseudouridine kinase